MYQYLRVLIVLCISSLACSIYAAIVFINASPLPLGVVNQADLSRLAVSPDGMTYIVAGMTDQDWVLGKQKYPLATMDTIKGGSVMYGPDGQSLLCIGKSGTKQRLIYKSALSPLVDEIDTSSIRFSHDGLAIIYIIRNEKKDYIVRLSTREGTFEESPAFQSINRRPFRLLSDNRLVFIARVGNTSQLVQGPFDALTFGTPSSMISDFSISPDEKSIAYIGIDIGIARVTTQTLYINGTEVQTGEDFALPVFSPDGQSYVFASKKPQEKWWKLNYRGACATRISKEEQTRTYFLIGKPVFSPDSTRLAVPVCPGGFWALVVDGQHREEMYEAIDSVIFSADNKKIAYAAREGMEWFPILDGERKYAGVVEIKPITFTAGNAHLLYLAKNGNRWAFFLDGEHFVNNINELKTTIFFATPNKAHFIGVKEIETAILGAESKYEIIRGEIEFQFTD